MTFSNFQFDFMDLKLDVQQMERVMGYRDGEADQPVTELIDEVLHEASLICSIKGEYRSFDRCIFDETKKSVVINDVEFNIGKIIYAQIKKADKIALFLCTAGEEIGIKSRTSMKEGDLLRGYVYDVVGSEIVEAATDLMQDELEKVCAASGNRITNRFSPGYCGWDVVEQHKLFSLLPDNYCGIRLTDSALMDPVKSVSGIIGIGENVKRLPYTCSLCDMRDCLYRRKA